MLGGYFGQFTGHCVPMINSIGVSSEVTSKVKRLKVKWGWKSFYHKLLRVYKYYNNITNPI